MSTKNRYGASKCFHLEGKLTSQQIYNLKHEFELGKPY